MAELGLELPAAPAALASYVPYVVAGELVFISGQLPLRDGKLVAAGKVGREVTLAEAVEAARVTSLNLLAQLSVAAGGLSNVRRIVRLGAFVNSGEGFTDQAKVANGASELMVEVFGDAGRHARAAVGVSELPLDAAVEIEMIAHIR